MRKPSSSELQRAGSSCLRVVLEVGLVGDGGGGFSVGQSVAIKPASNRHADFLQVL